jgi:SAM-dependent methyltransferase
MDERPSRARTTRVIEEQARYHRLKDVQDYRSAEGLIMALMFRKAHEHAAQHADGPILDVGCNTGLGTSILRELTGLPVTGVDVSPRAINAARQGYGGDFRIIDGRTLPFANASFGAVTCFQVIEHIADLDPFLAEIRRVLRPGGSATFTTPNAAIRLEPGQRPWYRFHCQEFRPEELRSLLTLYFQAVEVLGLFGPPELEAIERARVGRLRKIGRLRQPFARLLPLALEDRLVRLVREAVSRLQRSSTAKQFEQFTTADLRYQAEDLVQALDLMAVCWR